METKLPRAELLRLIAATSKVVEARNTIPILAMVKLTLDGGKLTCQGTDLDIAVTASCEAEGSDGALCVDAKLFADIVKKASGDISLAAGAGGLVVKAGRSRFKLNTLPAEAFPQFGEDTYAATFDIDLAALFAPVSFAISTEETRYYLGGVFFKGDGDAVVAVATDGHRLARHVIEADPTFAGVIVPRKMVGIVPKGTLSVSVSDTKIRVSAPDGTVIVSKLVDGSFPDYERVIPKGNDKIVTADRESLMKAADRVATVSNERGNAVRLSVVSGSISLSVRGNDGEATDEVEAEYGGAPVDIGFNSLYLRDVLGVFPAGSVTLAISDGGGPALLTGGVEGLDVVLMPVRVLA